MTTITANVIADSVSDVGIRLTTLALRYPRFIHSEVMTHRMFSRNASSSRAIPIEKLIADIKADPAMPLHWGAAQKGMQADNETNAPLTFFDGQQFPVSREEAWQIAMGAAIETALAFSKAGYHKQVANRLLEPYAHINVLVTSTSWANFFALRDHPDAEPHIAMLARAMKQAMAESTPVKLKPLQWHLPYVQTVFTNGYFDGYRVVTGDDDWMRVDVDTATRVSVARCARVSYLTYDGKRSSIEADLALFNQLVGSAPLHASPAEHQATPDTHHGAGDSYFDWDNPEEHGNLYGWRQYRKLFPNEFVPD